MARLTVSLKRQTAMHVTRVTAGREKLVYVIVADKKVKYPTGRSRVVYIGTTKKGLSRISQSAASRAESVLSRRGIRAFDVRVVTCKPRQRVKTWFKLERALLLSFRDKYGDVPACNSHGRKMKVIDEFKYFSRKRLITVLDDLA